MRRRMKGPPTVQPGDPFYWNYVVGVNIRRVRVARGLTQAQLAKLMTSVGDVLSAVAISNLEMHTMNPDNVNRVTPRTSMPVDRLMALAQALGTTYLDLLREDTLPGAARKR